MLFAALANLIQGDSRDIGVGTHATAGQSPWNLVRLRTKPITISAPGCTIKIPSQTKTLVAYENLGAGANRDISVATVLTEVNYTTAGVLCGTHNEIDGVYEAGNTYKAYVDSGGRKGAQRGVWLE